VKPFLDTELYQFTDRKLQGSKGKKIQKQLECSIKGFHDALTDTSQKWKSVDAWPPVFKLLKKLHRSVDRYYSKLFSQLARRALVHTSNAPVRAPSEAITCKTVERHLSSLTVAKDLRTLNCHLIASHEYVFIDVNDI